MPPRSRADPRCWTWSPRLFHQFRAATLVVLVAASQSAAAQSFLGPGMPYKAFAQLPKSEIEVGGGILEVGFAPGRIRLGTSKLLAWVERSGHAIAAYYGRFPLRRARVLIVPVGGAGIGSGQAFGYGGAAVRIQVGRNSRPHHLADDWKMVHELSHLAIPNLARRYDWVSEGLAVYVEPIARAQAGHLRPQAVWAEFVAGLPKGQPKAGDRGLDHTPTWGRRYWGGALFFFVADVELREQTGNRAGLQQALRGLMAGGANHEQVWPVRRLLQALDRATGTGVVMGLYERMRATPVTIDLAALWRRLGVRLKRKRIVIDDAAPLAPIRRAILSRPSDNGATR